jgi:ribosome-associated heat shock protein Hsp15
MPNKSSEPLTKVRLDKWLWAARFYKTRAIAKQAIEGGKVQCEGARSKPSKEITIGTVITLRQGFDEKVVVVAGLSEQRRNAPEAQALYEETKESIAKRELFAEQRKSQPNHWPSPSKPNKKERRMIHRFKQGEGS